ncbi:hypothetical protein CMI37_28165 [Candidatus Pacearchaeota archaeon]|nr:hypothetical protein [Candidatus Pacearchaeota archaeon]|tara:strand:- start:258 stop:707 length:450 start_codon:yes stop_codon:yes gene_type:complete
MKIVDIADEIYRELGSPSTISIPPITFWLRANMGALNNHINENYFIDTDLEIVKSVDSSNHEINEEAKSILKMMYSVHYYDVQIRSTLGAAAVDSVVEIQSDDTRVKRINKNELSKTFYNLKRVETEELHKLINAYKLRESVPTQIEKK